MLLLAMLAYNLLHVFYARNLKPPSAAVPAPAHRA